MDVLVVQEEFVERLFEGSQESDLVMMMAIQF
jgi:hypothetical protein